MVCKMVLAVSAYYDNSGGIINRKMDVFDSISEESRLG